eukprot:scaffold86007_cov118-Phaeocystis_antarctica.AAC.3
MAPKTDVQPIARSSLAPGEVRHSSIDKTDTIGELCGASSQHILHHKAVRAVGRPRDRIAPLVSLVLRQHDRAHLRGVAPKSLIRAAIHTAVCKWSGEAGYESLQ